MRVADHRTLAGVRAPASAAIGRIGCVIGCDQQLPSSSAIWIITAAVSICRDHGTLHSCDSSQTVTYSAGRVETTPFQRPLHHIQALQPSLTGAHRLGENKSAVGRGYRLLFYLERISLPAAKASLNLSGTSSWSGCEENEYLLVCVSHDYWLHGSGPTTGSTIEPALRRTLGKGPCRLAAVPL